MTVIFERIKRWLENAGIPFRTLHHEPTLTSAASAEARGEDLAIGGKAIAMKIDSEFKMFVISAARQIDSRKVKAYFKAKSLRFATAEELASITGLVPGAVPPFGRPILDFDLYVDFSIEQNEKIAFNAGSLTDSIIMQTTDYLRISQPTIFDFARAG